MNAYNAATWFAAKSANMIFLARWDANVAAYLPILIYLIAVIGFAAVSLVLPHLVGPRKPTIVKDMPYESGMDPIGDVRKPLDIKFYLMAILFLVFDVELLFLYISIRTGIRVAVRKNFTDEKIHKCLSVRYICIKCYDCLRQG